MGNILDVRFSALRSLRGAKRIGLTTGGQKVIAGFS